MNKLLLIILSSMITLSMACGFIVNFPIEKVSTGPTQTEVISIPSPDSPVSDLKIIFGAGDLEIEDGAEDVLVSGRARYNVPGFKPVIKQEGNEIHLETGNLEINSIPNIHKKIINEWDLRLGSQLMRLSINAGAYKGDYDFGGLFLQLLEITDGASDVKISFSEPNKAQMDSLLYITGASKVRMNGLANANFSSMIFRAGAGDYELDFSGELRKDTVAAIESGISRVVIIVPKGTSSRVIFRGGLAKVNASEDWKKSGDIYELTGSSPLLTINIDMAAGNLELQTD